MRIVLLLIVLAAIAFSTTHALKTGAPAVPGAPAPAAGAAPTPAETVRKFEEDVNALVQDAAAERARQIEDAAR